MESAADYRSRAIEQRRSGASASQPLVRLMHKKAAERWDSYADQIECDAPEGDGLVRQQSAFSV